MNPVSPPIDGAAHKHGSSANTATVVPIARTKDATGMWITAKTNNARVCFDGETPTAALGLVIPAGAIPVFFPFATDLKFCSENAAAASELDVLYTG